MTNESLDDQIKALQDALEASRNEPMPGAAMQVEDLMPVAEKYLTDKAKDALGRKAMNLIVQEPGRLSECIFLAVRVPNDKLEEGVKVVAGKVNALAEDGLIHSTLSPMASVELAHLPLEVKSSVVLCYVLVPSEQKKELTAKLEALEEGEMPKPMFPVRVNIPDGEVRAVIRVSPHMNLMGGQVDERINDHLKREIELILNVLPKGTMVASVERRAIVGLSIPYEVRFLNPLFTTVKTLETNWVRQCAVVNGELKQYNLFTGISYFDQEGQQLFTLQEAVRPTTRS